MTDHDHEASRPAFEANFKQGNHGELAECIKVLMWAGWKAALDYAASRKCGMIVKSVTAGKVTIYEHQQECGAIHGSVNQPIDFIKHPFCPGCGRKVEVKTTEPTP